jgi:signal transduction histidine kinase
MSILLNADPDRIVQTLTNLLSNAIKFSPAQTTVQMQAYSSADTSSVCIRVCDQGRGIPFHQIQTIFERFQQVDASDARQKGGTGLGLSICRNIIEQHGGRIWVESTVNQGSTFYIELPLNA